MRSSVCVILRSASPDNQLMALPDYTERALHHRTILVLVQPVGSQIDESVFARIYSHVSSIDTLAPAATADCESGQRLARLRYRRLYSTTANAWSQFQTHRAALALITVGAVRDVQDFCEVYREHERVRQLYSSTLIDHRCVIYCEAGTVTGTGGCDTSSGAEVPASRQSSSCVLHADTLLRHIEKIDDICQSPREHNAPATSANDTVDSDECRFDANDKDSGVYEHLSLGDTSSSSDSDTVTRRHTPPVSNCRLTGCNGTHPLDSQHLTTTPSAVEHDRSAGRISHFSLFDDSGLACDELSKLCADTTHESVGVSPTQSFAPACVSHQGDVPHAEVLHQGDEPDSYLVPGTCVVLLHAIRDNCLHTCLYDLSTAVFCVLEARRMQLLLRLTGSSSASSPAESVAGDSLGFLSDRLCAPFERKACAGLDSKNQRRRMMARGRKRLGDLCLQTGRMTEAVKFYRAACHGLRQTNDWLWLADAFEGMCAASICYMSEFSETVVSLSSSTDSDRFVHNLSVGSQPSIKDQSIKKSTTDLDNSSSSSTSCSATKELEQNSFLSSEEIFNKLREATHHYSKYCKASVIEVECCMKAVCYFTETGNYLYAADFITNLLFINVQSAPPSEKVDRLEALADICLRCNFRRKRAFLLRLAAFCCVNRTSCLHNITNSSSSDRRARDTGTTGDTTATGDTGDISWHRCYRNLCACLAGYRLHVDAQHVHEPASGWPALQYAVTRELCQAAERCGHHAVAHRLTCHALQTLFWRVTARQRTALALSVECCQQVSLVAARSCLALGAAGVVCAPIQLHYLPVFRSFRPLPYLPHLRPHLRIQPRDQLFIYTPLTSNRMSSEICWVVGELCQVDVSTENLLLADLRVTDVAVLSEGATIDQFSCSISLTAASGCHVVNLVVSPVEAGQLRLIGYTLKALGVELVCYLRDMPWLTSQQQQCTVRVVPPLPRLQLSQRVAATYAVCAFTADTVVCAVQDVTLFNGQTHVTQLRLENCSCVCVEQLQVTLQEEELGKFITVEIDSTRLPLCENASLIVNVRIHADCAFFLCREEFKQLVDIKDGDGDSQSDSASVANSSLNTFASIVRRSFKNRSFCSQKVGKSDVYQTSSRQSNSLSKTIVDAFSVFMSPSLKVTYSGGEGLQAGYQRAFKVEFSTCILPSLLITHVDVICAESDEWAYLLLDLFNTTDFEIEITYSGSKHALAESGDCCKIAVPIRRFPLSNNDISNDRERIIQHIVDQSDITWSALTLCGCLSLRGVCWTDTLLNSFRAFPYALNIYCDDCRLTTDVSELSLSLGVPYTVRTELLNISDNQTGADAVSVRSRLKISDMCEGRLPVKIENIVAVSGSLCHRISHLEAGSVAQNTYTLVFCSPGTYSLETSVCESPSACEQEPIARNWRLCTLSVV